MQKELEWSDLFVLNTRLGSEPLWEASLWAKVKYVFSWDKTLQLAAAGQQSDALAVLDSLEPRFAKDLEVRILRMSLLWQLDRFNSVVESGPEILLAIKADRRLRLVDKTYLYAFVRTLTESADAARRGLPHEIYDRTKTNWNEIALGKVSKHLKMNYPLRVHPLWKDV